MTICRALLVLLLAVPPVMADQPSAREQARALLRAGNQLHDRGDYVGALQRYREARALFPTFKIDFNIGVTLEAMGRAIEAAEQFERFLARASTIADSSIVSSARQRLAALRSRLASVSVRCSVRGAMIAVNGGDIGEAPFDGRVYLRPGTHRVAVRAERYLRFERELFLEAGDHRVVVAVLRSDVAARPPRDPAAATPRRSRGRPTPVYKRWWFWTLVGAVVAGGVVGGVVAGTRGDGRVPSGELGTIP